LKAGKELDAMRTTRTLKVTKIRRPLGGGAPRPGPQPPWGAARRRRTARGAGGRWAGGRWAGGPAGRPRAPT